MYFKAGLEAWVTASSKYEYYFRCDRESLSLCISLRPRPGTGKQPCSRHLITKDRSRVKILHVFSEHHSGAKGRDPPIL